MKIFLTGIAGTGKTTILSELQKRGYVVIDLDATGMCRWRNKETQEITEYGPTGRNYEWLTYHGWYCDILTLQKLLSCIRKDKDVFVAGITENIEEVVQEFDKVFIFEASDEVVKERLRKRTNNHFAQKEDEQEFIFKHSRELLKKVTNVIEIDASRTPTEITEDILNNIKNDTSR